jgi:aromatic-L-amino-acid/L-tryptophan decarboxylase
MSENRKANNSAENERAPDAAAFREAGHQLIDWIANYLENVEQHKVRPELTPGQYRARLPEDLPKERVSLAALVAGLDADVLPGITHWQHPSFFAYFPANSSYASILGDLASTGLGVNGMLWATSPAATEMEAHMLDWMARLLGLPEKFLSTSASGGGVIQGTASEATLCALLAARERTTAGASNRDGLAGKPPLVVYGSKESHSSLLKAARIAGIGEQNVRLIETDAAHAMKPDALAKAIEADRQAGRVPCFVFVTRGTTSTMAFDPTVEIGAICKQNNLWMHVDAAMSGIAGLCEEYRWVNEGLEFADSYCTNPHKWMGVVFDCDTFWVADKHALTSALSILPEYLRTPETGAVIDYRDWQIPLGRRFRALKLWFSLRSGAAEDAKGMIRAHVAMTQTFAAWVFAHTQLEVLAPHPLNLVVFAAREGNEVTARLLAKMNASGEALCTQTKIAERYAIRVSIGARLTEARHVQALQDLIQRCLTELSAGV